MAFIDHLIIVILLFIGL